MSIDGMIQTLYIERRFRVCCDSPFGGNVPTILRLLNWRFHFYSDEGAEPPHIHVDTGDGDAARAFPRNYGAKAPVSE